MLSSSPRVPQELVDYIIDYLHHDRAALNQCALVRRAWTRHAQSHLFQTVLIRSAKELDGLTELFVQSPSIALLVRTLRIKAYRHWMSSSASPELLCWIRAVPQILPSKLSRLRAIHFEHVQWDTFRLDNAFLRDLSKFSRVSLRELSFSSCNFSSFRTLEQFVCAFDDLERLSLDAVSWRDSIPELSLEYALGTPLKSMPRLTELRIGRFCSMKTIFEWFLNSPARTSLHTLALETVTSKEELSLVGRLLMKLGPSLKHFKLGCKFDRMPKLQKVINDYIDLSYNTQLRSLHLLILDLRDDMMPWVPKILSQIAAPHLDRIQFDIWLFSPRQLGTQPWNEITWMLTHPRYLSVREISFVHRGYMDIEDADSTLRKRLEALDKRHVLVVEDGRPVSSS